MSDASTLSYDSAQVVWQEEDAVLEDADSTHTLNINTSFMLIPSCATKSDSCINPTANVSAAPKNDRSPAWHLSPSGPATQQQVQQWLQQMEAAAAMRRAANRITPASRCSSPSFDGLTNNSCVRPGSRPSSMGPPAPAAGRCNPVLDNGWKDSGSSSSSMHASPAGMPELPPPAFVLLGLL